MKGSRNVKLTLKNNRRLKAQQHYPSREESVKDTATNNEGWFESDAADDRQVIRKKQLLDTSTGSKSRGNSLSALRGTTRRLFVIGGKFLHLTFRILIRCTIYLILYSSQNPRKAAPFIFAFLMIAFLSKGTTRTSTPKSYTENLLIHENYTLPQENFSPPNASLTLKTIVQEQEEQERQELLTRLSDKLVNPITPKDTRTGIDASVNDKNNEELLKLLGSLIAQANTAKQLQVKGSNGDLEEGGNSSYSKNFYIQQSDSSKDVPEEKLSPQYNLNSEHLREVNISMQQASGRNITANDTDLNSFGNFTIMKKTDPDFYEAANVSSEAKDFFPKISELFNQSESMVDAVSLPTLFDRLENVRGSNKNKKRLFRRSKNIPYFWYIPLGR
jgi:hypothetical protein